MVKQSRVGSFALAATVLKADESSLCPQAVWDGDGDSAFLGASAAVPSLSQLFSASKTGRWSNLTPELYRESKAPGVHTLGNY